MRIKVPQPTQGTRGAHDDEQEKAASVGERFNCTAARNATPGAHQCEEGDLARPPPPAMQCTKTPVASEFEGNEWRHTASL